MTKSPTMCGPRLNILDDPVTQYAEDVLSGAIVAGPHVRASCRRHLKDLKRKDIFWDLAAADYALGFFPGILRLSEGQFDGIPFNLEPSQAFIVGSIFGWKRKNGTRRFRRAYLEQAKGNGKTPLAAGIGLFGMLSDKEPGAQIYAGGAKKDQADILFQDAVKMVKQSPALSARVTNSGSSHVWNMADFESGSFFRPISRESGKTGSGPRPHFALCDEVHEHPNRDVLDTLERGFKFRRQPLLLMTTNSGSDRNSLCWEEHCHAVAVAHGDTDDDTTFSYVCALDEDDDPLIDPECWIKANPLLGVILEADYLRDVAAQALAIPGKMNGILRLHFCQWTDSDTAWISREAWEACEDPDMTIDEFNDCRFWAGLDLSATKDMTATVKVFEDGFTDQTTDEDGNVIPPQPKFAAFCRAYTPKDTLQTRAREDKAPYDVWVRDGHLTATPGPKIRYDYVAEDLVSDAELYQCEAVVYDRYLIKLFEDALDETGATFDIIEHPQGLGQRKDSNLWMPGSIDMLETLILERRIRIAVNPVLRSAVASACFHESPAGLRRFEKQKATSRIDCAVALAMAVGGATDKDRVEAVSSPWEDPEYSIAN
jgi:phage terminase large subunit-like protein